MRHFMQHVLARNLPIAATQLQVLSYKRQTPEFPSYEKYDSHLRKKQCKKLKNTCHIRQLREQYALLRVRAK